MKFLLLLAVLLLSPVSAFAQTATPTVTATLPFCSTPAPAALTYEEEVLATSPLAYWRLDETNGTIAIDQTGNGRHGTISGVTLNATTFLDGSPAPSFDGINDWINIYSVSLRDALNSSAGAWQIWAITNWGEAANRSLFAMRNTSPSVFGILKSSLGANTLRYTGGVPATGVILSSSSWRHIVLTWDASANAARVYLDNALLIASTYSAFAANINQMTIGSRDNAAEFWSGNLSNSAIWNRVLTADEISELYSVPVSAEATATPPCQVYNPTPTRTPDLYAIWTLPAPAGETDGQAVALSYQLSMDGLINSILLFAIWVLMLIAISRWMMRPGNAR